MFYIPLSPSDENKFIHSLNYYFFLSSFLESLLPMGGSRACLLRPGVSMSIRKLVLSKRNLKITASLNFYFLNDERR